jgi:Ulp1 protease family, C-terminal catalytic domain
MEEVYVASTRVVQHFKEQGLPVTWFQIFLHIQSNAAQYEALTGIGAVFKPPWVTQEPQSWQMMQEQAGVSDASESSGQGDGQTACKDNMNWGLPTRCLRRRKGCSGDVKKWKRVSNRVYDSCSAWWIKVYPPAKLQLSLRSGSFVQKLREASIGVAGDVQLAALMLLASSGVDQQHLYFIGDPAAYHPWTRWRAWLARQIMPETPVTNQEDPLNIDEQGFVRDAYPVTPSSESAAGPLGPTASPPRLVAAAGPAAAGPGPGQSPTGIVAAAPTPTPSSLTLWPHVGILSAAGLTFHHDRACMPGLVPADLPLPPLWSLVAVGSWCKEAVQQVASISESTPQTLVTVTSRDDVQHNCFASMARVQGALWGPGGKGWRQSEWSTQLRAAQPNEDGSETCLSFLDSKSGKMVPRMLRFLPPGPCGGRNVGPLVTWPCAGVGGTATDLGAGWLDTSCMLWALQVMAVNMGLSVAPLIGPVDMGSCESTVFVVDDLFVGQLANGNYSSSSLSVKQETFMVKNPLEYWKEASWVTQPPDQPPRRDGFPGYPFMDKDSRSHRKRFGKIRIWEKHVLLVPINVDQSHWILGIVDFPNTTILVLDSMGVAHPLAVALLARWVVDFSNWDGPVSQSKKDVPPAGAW